ncbi:MAG: ABC transporter ATP-binding protein [Opitutaceae bacterium]|nr:ABC transporter ATP-binding protein [Opitutaceae bacterium]
MNKGEVLARARAVSKSYDDGRIVVLRDASLEVRAGELVALWGASGSGKSTLLHLLGGLDSPDQGELNVCGLDPTGEANRLTLRRHRIGFVFQLHNLIPDLTVTENLRVPAIATGKNGAETTERIRVLAEQVGIGHRLTHRIQDLSGGERQRTAICRALMNKPQLLLADEPTGSLDEITGNTIFALLKQLAERDRIAVVMATHERRFAEACHRIIRVRDGRLDEIAG